MPPIRILPILICVALAGLGARLWDVGGVAVAWALDADEAVPTQIATAGTDQPMRTTIPRLPSAPPSPAQTDRPAEPDGFNPLTASADERAMLVALAERRRKLDARAERLERTLTLQKAAERRIDQQIDELSALRAGIAEAMDPAASADPERIARLAKIYSRMKDDDAARILQDLEPRTQMALARSIPERIFAKIMGEMNPGIAARLTRKMAEVPDLPVPR